MKSTREFRQQKILQYHQGQTWLEIIFFPETVTIVSAKSTLTPKTHFFQTNLKFYKLNTMVTTNLNGALNNSIYQPSSEAKKITQLKN